MTVLSLTVCRLGGGWLKHGDFFGRMYAALRPVMCQTINRIIASNIRTYISQPIEGSSIQPKSQIRIINKAVRKNLEVALQDLSRI